MDFNNSDQLKSFLKSESNRLGISINNTYNTYFARLLLERINKLSYNEILVKGSFSEYGHIGKLVRPITDVDLTSKEDADKILEIIFKALYKSNKINGINFELIKCPYQTKTGIYKIPFVVSYGKINHHMTIDFQEKANTIYSKSYQVIKPIFKGDYYFGVCMPTIEEYLAEKICIIIENNKSDVLNTRVKDFYDIWKLLECNYNPNLVEQYFSLMINDRGKIDTRDLDASFLNGSFVQNHQEIWNNMSQKYEFLDKNISFKEAVRVSRKIAEHEINYYNKTLKKRKSK